jgi:hypothetical protein
MRRFALSGVLVGLLAFPAGATATSQTASSGDVSATFTFSGHTSHFSHERLTISQAGAVLYRQPVVSGVCGSQCAPGSAFTQQSSLQVLDLEHNGQPDVVLNLFTGGAHCCLVDQVFSLDPTTMTYVKTERNFGDPGAQIVDLRHEGRFEFLTADDSFAYAFTDFAASGLPIQIFTFGARHFTDVTRQYPRLIAKDASRWMRIFRSLAKSHYRDSVGVAAAWAADEELLGHRRLVDRFLATQARARHLNSAIGHSGTKFIAALRRFLRRHGYLS